MLRKLLPILALVAGMLTPAGPAQAAVTASQIPVPGATMGWNSWNSFAARINYNVIKQQTDAFVALGLPAAGYQYINIDEGWWQGTRDSPGNIVVDTSEWPGGMGAIADYIHSKGLKAGIYTDAGRDGCGYYYPTGRPPTYPSTLESLCGQRRSAGDACFKPQVSPSLLSLPPLASMRLPGLR